MSQQKPSDFASLLEEARDEGARAAHEFEKLATEVGGENLFAAVFAHLVLTPAETANELTHGPVPIKLELLAFRLLPLFSVQGAESIDAFHISRALDALEALFMSYHRMSMFAKLHDTQSSDSSARELDDLAWLVRLDAETVRGSAYPEQIAEEITKTLGRFDDWFEAHVGICPSRAAKALLAIVTAHESRATSWFPELAESSKSMRERFAAARRSLKGHPTDEDRVFLQMFRRRSHAGSFGYSTRLAELAVDLPATQDSIYMLPPITRQELEALCGLIGCSPDVRSKMTEPIEMIHPPLRTTSGR